MKTADPIRRPATAPNAEARKPLSSGEAARAAIRLLTQSGIELTPGNYRQAWIRVGGPPLDSDLEHLASSAVGLLRRHAPTDTMATLIGFMSTQRWAEAQAILSRLEHVGAADPSPAMRPVEAGKSAGSPASDTALDTRRSNSQLRKLNAELVEIVGALCSSFEAMSEPDSWIATQVKAVRDAVKDGSDRRSLASARSLIEQALEGQHDISLTRRDAVSALRDLLPNLVEQMSHLGERSGDFGATLSGHMEAISQADSLESIAERVRSLVADAHSMQVSVGDAQRGLQSSSERAQSLESQVVRLEQELAQASERLLTDHLTRTANRAGLEQAYLREIVPVRDESRLLTVGLLDIDDFKRVNDVLGHHAGDGALQHLASLLQSKVRPCDTVARYGGEEFVLLLPGLGVEEASDLLMKVQRELTRDVYLYDAKKVFITFSAGATLVMPDDSLESALLRADEAMYQAKNSGKNCVAVV